MKRLDVIAIGGNAILPVGHSGTIEEQIAVTRVAMEQIAELVGGGRKVVLTHGNGPIVGNIVIRNEAAKRIVPPMPLDVCGADSQGGIGYMIQQTLRNALRSRKLEREVVSIVTQVLVDPRDEAFDNPVKPIGPYYTEADARKLEREMGWRIVEDDRGGYRRVVPSPYPIRIVETEVVKRLVDLGVIVITVGGGGIPVIDDGKRLKGVDAVIDKDLASSLLARELKAERLIILTDVDAVYKDYGSVKAEPLRRIGLREASALDADGHFPPGSMGSKIRAAMEFVRAGGGTAVIAQPEDLVGAVAGRKGTTIYGDSTDED